MIRGAAVLARVQGGLEQLYRVETGLEVAAFVVDDVQRAEALGRDTDRTRRPREQLLVSHADGDVQMALFLDEHALENLAQHDPAVGLSDHNFGDFCLAVEGVSHFIYVALRAASDRQVTALELELQAEIDKFVSCFLMQGAQGSTLLRERLFDRVTFDGNLDASERNRYEMANQQARKYAGVLDRRYLCQDRLNEMFGELRRFYRLGLQEKLGHIAATAH